MGKVVVILASGETEQGSLPHLVAHLQQDGIEVREVRIPPRSRALNVEMVEKLVKASWYERPEAPPDKFVVLVDTDRRTQDEVLTTFREQLPRRIPTKIQAQVLFACAQQHLEAWFFADGTGLRGYLKRDLGNVDLSAPDAIQDPKHHLKNLLGERAYSSVISEEIAQVLDPEVISERSPSFRSFLEAVRNGAPPA